MGAVSIRFNLVLEGKLRSLGDDLLFTKPQQLMIIKNRWRIKNG
jgi:hypothetical protein